MSEDAMQSRLEAIRSIPAAYSNPESAAYRKRVLLEAAASGVEPTPAQAAYMARTYRPTVKELRDATGMGFREAGGLLGTINAAIPQGSGYLVDYNRVRQSAAEPSYLQNALLTALSQAQAAGAFTRPYQNRAYSSLLQQYGAPVPAEGIGSLIMYKPPSSTSRGYQYLGGPELPYTPASDLLKGLGSLPFGRNYLRRR
jgi:hypothetical protein